MLRVEKVNKIYRDGKENLHVLKDVNLEISKGDLTAIIGPSGAGKSTLLHIAGGLDTPSSGNVFLEEENLYCLSDEKRAYLRNEKIGFVFQFYHLLSEFNALENVMMPGVVRTQGHQDPVPLARLASRAQRASLGYGAGTRTQGVKDRAIQLLKDVGLENRMLHKPSELSGGEQQRVAIARALINEPDILLCDEPTGNLDSAMGKEVLDILYSLNKNKQTTIAIVTHDKSISGSVSRVIEMRDGKIV